MPVFETSVTVPAVFKAFVCCSAATVAPSASTILMLPDVPVFVAASVAADVNTAVAAPGAPEPIPVAAASVNTLPDNVPAVRVIAPLAAPPPFAVNVRLLVAVKLAPIAMPPVLLTSATFGAFTGAVRALIVIAPVFVGAPIVSSAPAVTRSSSAAVSPRVPAVSVPTSMGRAAALVVSVTAPVVDTRGVAVVVTRTTSSAWSVTAPLVLLTER